MSNYQQVSTIADMHHAPRFGYTSEIAKAASIDPTDRSDYFFGVGAFSLFLLFFFIVWGISLLMLTFAGHHRVGWGSGRIYTTGKRDVQAAFILKRRIQFLFTISCLPVFLGCVTLIGDGLGPAQVAVVEMKKLNQDIRSVIYEGMNIATTALRVQKNLSPDQVGPLFEVDKLCLKKIDDPLVNYTYLSSTLDGIANEFDRISAYINENISEVHTDMLMLRESSKKVEDYFIWFQENDWLVKMFVLLIGTITLFMLSATILSTFGLSNPPLRFMIGYFLLPIFITLLLAASLGSCALAVVTIMNADFCSGGDYPGSPEGTIEDAFTYAGFGEDHLLPQSFSYYKNGCMVENPVETAYGYGNNLNNIIGLADNVLSQTSFVASETLNASCGVDFNQMWEAATILKLNTETALENLESIFEFSSCSKISPFYRRVFHGVTCKESVVGLTWMFASLALICFSGLLMVSLRAGMFAIRVEIKPGKNSISEQEEYEDFIRRFYGVSRERGNGGNHGNIQRTATFDTDTTTSKHSDDEYSDDHTVDLESIYSTPSRMLREEETFPLSPPERRPKITKAEINQVEDAITIDETLPLSPRFAQLNHFVDEMIHHETLPLSPQNKRDELNQRVSNEFIDAEIVPVSPNSLIQDDLSTASI
uniref:Protein tweety homolog n=1 Tax=Ditylum brightwellii TaxID=49249 RepID=A0A6U3T8E0_9STRA|mmetsp:Transcript_3585/g.5566  ORF Transcript_3585/g.5566 Transcript_3585/m.5566 type:complete len:651 (+) Transcript_3585:225-2177(+)